MSDEQHIDFDGGGKQPYHLVDPSPWPLAGAFAGGLLAVGMLLFMHDVKIGGMSVGLMGPLLGLMAVLAVMFVWWRDVIKEAVVQKVHTAPVKIGFRYGMLLFIASEVMFFAAFFWAFFDASLFIDEAKQFLRTTYSGGTWPPQGIEAIKAFDLPFMMTLILLLSGTTVTWAHHAIIENKQKDAVLALGITIFLGIMFTGIQAFEYAHAPFGFKDGVFTSTFFMATGFHGLHVLIGTIFLIVCWVRTIKGHFTPNNHFGFEAAAWYWHFVDVVWLFLFCAVYWWTGASAGI